MRNLKKLTAILLVSAMCIGTAFTSFAAEGDGPSENGNGGTEQTTPTPTPGDDISMGENDIVALDKDGNAVVIRQEAITDDKVIEALSSQEGLKDILGTKFEVGSKDEVVVIAAGELTIDGEMPEGGLDFVIDVSGEGVVAGNTVYVLHKKSNGTWEVYAAVVKEDGSIEFHLDSLSPVAIVKVMSDGSVKVLKEKATTSTKKSPKTGE